MSNVVIKMVDFILNTAEFDQSLPGVLHRDRFDVIFGSPN